MSDRYAHLMKFLEGQAWAILPEKLLALREVVRLRAAGVRFTDGEIRQRLGLDYDDEMPKPKPAQTAGVLVLPLYGILCPKANMITEYSGGTSLEAFGRVFRQGLADPGVGSIVIEHDSPGGSTYGVEELWNTLFAARGAKRIVSVVSPMACSASYWLATATDEIVATPSGDLGSIGVYHIHEDLSKALEQEGIGVEFISAGEFKTEGNPYEPLTDAARAHIRSLVEATYQVFVKQVAKGRGVSTSEALKNYGQGRVVHARDAVARGMADRLGTLEDTVAKLSGRKPNGGARAVAVQIGTYAESLTPTWTATDDAPPAEIPPVPADPEPEPIAEPEPAVAVVGAGAGEIERRRRELELLNVQGARVSRA